MNTLQASDYDSAAGGALAEKTSRKLEAMIRGRQLKPGSHLSERRVAKMLGVSRTSVRSAFKRLEDANLLVAEGPRGGRCVVDVFERDTDPEVFIERLEARRALLGEAVYLAAQNMNPQELQTVEHLLKDEQCDAAAVMFDYIVSHCGNRCVRNIWKREGFTEIGVGKELKEDFDRIIGAQQDSVTHFLVEAYEAIIARNAEEARNNIMRFHELEIWSLRSLVAERTARKITESYGNSEKSGDGDGQSDSQGASSAD